MLKRPSEIFLFSLMRGVVDAASSAGASPEAACERELREKTDEVRREEDKDETGVDAKGKSAADGETDEAEEYSEELVLSGEDF